MTKLNASDAATANPQIAPSATEVVRASPPSSPPRTAIEIPISTRAVVTQVAERVRSPAKRNENMPAQIGTVATPKSTIATGAMAIPK